MSVSLCLKTKDLFFFSISETGFLSNVRSVSQIRMIDINVLFVCLFFALFFPAENDMILLGILASTPKNDCEMTCLGLI